MKNSLSSGCLVIGLSPYTISVSHLPSKRSLFYSLIILWKNYSTILYFSIEREREKKERKRRKEKGKKTKKGQKVGRQEGINGACRDGSPPKCMLPFKLLMEMRHFPMDVAFLSNLLLSVMQSSLWILKTHLHFYFHLPNFLFLICLFL